MNQSMLVKLAWRVMTETDQLWKKILKHKYGSPLLDQVWNWERSHIWRGILYGAQTLEEVCSNEELMQPSAEKKVKVRELYKATTSGLQKHVKDAKWDKIWRFCGPTRLCFLLRIARHNRLPSVALFSSHINIGKSTCSVCIKEFESTLP